VSVSVSFEVFPPKTAAGIDQLANTTRRLLAVRPNYISVTYGAGGTDRDRSFAAIDAVQQGGATDIASHVTCVGQSRDDIDHTIDDYAALGVRHVVALRGDPPGGIDAPYEPHPEGYQTTADLVAAIKQRAGFDVSVSAYPERHPQSPSDAHDLDVLAAKVDAGADRAITQMFFDNAHYLRFVERAHARGIDVPIVPGIFPIHAPGAVARFAARCGASFPDTVAERFAGLEGDQESTYRVAAELCGEQVDELARNGVEHVHIYTLNRPDLTLAVCKRLGLQERADAS